MNEYWVDGHHVSAEHEGDALVEAQKGMQPSPGAA